MPHYIKTGYWALEKNGYKGWLNLEDIVGGGGGGTTGAENITYSQLYNNTVNGLLVPGKWYRVTDYRCVNFLNGFYIASNNPTPTDPNFNPRQIHVGDVEVLYVQGATPYSLSENGYSETYQGDVITYEPFTNKIGVNINIYNGQTLPDSSTVSGFDLQWDGTNVYFNMPAGYPLLFGHYLYLYCEFDGGNYYQDGTFDPVTPNISICQYPYTADDPDYGYPKAVSRIRVEDNGYKVVLIDLTETDYNNYDVDSLYIQTVEALGDAYGCITRRIDTFRNIDYPLDFRGRLYRRFEVDLSALNPSLGTGYYGQGDNYRGQGTTGNYKDLKVFDNTGEDVANIECIGLGGLSIYYRGNGDNSVFIYGGYNNKIGGFFVNNTIGDLNRSIIGDDFYNNTLGGGVYNTISTGCQNNLIASQINFNNISENFSFNIIGDFFQNNTFTSVYSVSNNIIDAGFQLNKISVIFQNNTIGGTFVNNLIDGGFLYNTVGSNFRYNIIKMGSDIVSVDFSSATHVYGSYTCEIFRRSNGTNQLSYIDGTNTVQYTSITA